MFACDGRNGVVLLADAEKKKANTAETGGQIEGICMNYASMLALPQFKTWASAYFHPEETFDAEKKNATLGNIAANAFIIGLISSVVGFIVNVASSLTATIISPRFSSLDIAMAAVVMVAGIILTPIGVFISSGIYFVIAKILGGKGGYMAQTLGIVLVSGGIVLLAAPLNLLSAIPCLGFAFALAGAAVALYGLYSQWKMIKKVHEMSGLRAAAVILIPIIIVVVIAIIAAVVMGAALVGLGALGSGLGGY
jgi:hypothetical protein